MAANEELKAQILRLHFVEHWRLSTIAEQLCVHHSTVEPVLGEAGVERSINSDAHYLTIYLSGVTLPSKCTRRGARRGPDFPTERCMTYGRQESFHPRFLDTKGTRRAFQLPLLDSSSTFARYIDIDLGHSGSIWHSRFPAPTVTSHYQSSILGHSFQRVQWLRDSHTRWYESISRRRGFRCCDCCWNSLWVVERRISRRQCCIACASRDNSPNSATSVYSVVYSLVRNWRAFKNTTNILLRDADCDVEHGSGCTQRSYRQNTRGTIAWCELSSNIRFRCHTGGTSTYHGGSASCCRCGLFDSGGIRAIGRRFRTRFCYHRREHFLPHA